MKRSIILLLTILLLSYSLALSQEDSEGEVLNITPVQKAPAIRGSGESFLRYLRDHHLFPKEAEVAGVTGAAIVEFMADSLGQPSEFLIKQEKPEGLGFGDSLLVAVKQMEFTPALYKTEGGWKPFSTQMLIVVKFDLEYETETEKEFPVFRTSGKSSLELED